MYGGRLSLNMTLMHPTLTTVIATERNYELRMNAADARRARFALSRVSPGFGPAGAPGRVMRPAHA